MSITVTRALTIVDTDDTTEAVDLSQHLLSGIITDADFDGASFTFEGAPEPDGTFVQVTNSAGTTVSVVAGASDHVIFEPQTFAGVPYLKLVSSAAQSGADTTVTLVLLEGAG